MGVSKTAPAVLTVEQPLPFCDYCGEPCRNPHTVEYDGMVDGPGYMMGEERCEHCDPEKP